MRWRNYAMATRNPEPAHRQTRTGSRAGRAATPATADINPRRVYDD